MVEVEKVCKGLGCCVLRDPDDHRRCGECPYNPHAISNAPCANGLMFNALALIRQQQERIKELEATQEPKPVKIETNNYNYPFYYCPNCNRDFEKFYKKPKYCDQCGQAVKWDG